MSACGAAERDPASSSAGQPGTTGGASVGGATGGGGLSTGGASGGGGRSGDADAGDAATAGGAGTGGAAGCALMRFEGDGYVLSVLGSGELASLQISSADFAALSDSESPTFSRWPAAVAPYFKDEFFWQLFVMREHPSTNPLAGQNLPARRAAEGLNIPADLFEPFPEKPNLHSILFLREDVDVGSDTFFHEMVHTWGQMIVPELPEQHWNVSDVNGFLGGHRRGGIEDLGDGTYEVAAAGFDKHPLADIEMYLAGLWPKEKVEPFHWLKNATYLSNLPDGTGFIMSADELVTVTIDDVIAQYGPRVPDASAAQHDFRMLPIVVTDVPLTQGDWDFYRWQLAYIQADAPAPAYDSTHASLFAPPNLRREVSGAMQNNFQEATHGVGTLKTDGLIETLVETGECVAQLPDTVNACARITQRAETCGVAASACTVDREFTNTDAACIADCADDATCDELTAAAAGVEGNWVDNAFTWCAWGCQCFEQRGCFK